MSLINYTCIETPAGRSLTVYAGGELHTVTDQQPHFEDLLDATKSQDEDGVLALLGQNLTQNIATSLMKLTDHVEYDEDSNQLLYDGTPIHGTITEHIITQITNGSSDWRPLVNFLERADANPSMRSRTQLYDWLVNTGITIAQDGRIVAYKGLTATGYSHHAGGAFVDDQWVDGQVPNFLGTTIHLDRKQIDDDPTQSCSYGLHVGSLHYASSYNYGQIATVLVDPADFVSVPKQDSGQKGRVARYEVIRVELTQKNAIATAVDRNSVVDPAELSKANTRSELDEVLDELEHPFTSKSDPDDED